MDINFDFQAERILRNVYGTTKGAIRMAVLQRDIQEGIDLSSTGRVFDAGCGAGQMSIWLAQAYPHLEFVLCDISEKMLSHAKEKAADAGVADRMTFIHGSVHDVEAKEFDLVMSHAVLEWVGEQSEHVRALSERVKSGGHLSMMAFNLHCHVKLLLMRGRLDIVRKEDYSREPDLRSLRPQQPVDPDELEEWLRENDLVTQLFSGVRTFYDYMEEITYPIPDEIMVEEELKFSRQEPYRRLARYLHYLCEKR